jgi:hypothetical protein
VRLTTLYLGHTGVTDITPLASLERLTTLDLHRTFVDLTPFASSVVYGDSNGVVQLVRSDNWTGVTDITPLASLVRLT